MITGKPLFNLPSKLYCTPSEYNFCFNIASKIVLWGFNDLVIGHHVDQRRKRNNEREKINEWFTLKSH